MAVDMIARMMAMGNGKIEKMRDTAIENPENGEVLKYDAEQGKWVNGTASGGGGTSDYTDLTNKPKINGVTLAGNKSLDDIGAADASEVEALLSGKVDKVTGKGLSTEDYTTAEKTKLAAIEAGAEENVQADWNQTDTTADDYIKNKPNIPSGVVVDTTYDATSQNAQAGVAVAQAVSTKVDKVTGKGLSTNDYTTVEKDKLAGIASGAEVNVQSDWSQSDSSADDYIKNKPTIPVVDQTYNSASANAQSGTAVASAIFGKISATDYATQTTGGTIKAWTTTDGSDTILHLATQ